MEDEAPVTKPAVKSKTVWVNLVGFVLIALVAVTTPEFEQTLTSLVGLLNTMGVMVDKVQVLAALGVVVTAANFVLRIWKTDTGIKGWLK